MDWVDAGKRYKPKALDAKDHESFAVIVNQMLAELKTSHTYYYTKWDPGYYALQAAFDSATWADVSTSEAAVIEQYLSELRSSAYKRRRTGIGVVTKEIDGRFYVAAVLKSSPAEEAGVMLGDWLVEVDSEPFHPIRSFENKAGQQLELIIQREPCEDTRRVVKVTPVEKNERELFESDSRASLNIIEYKGHQFVYIRLWWLNGFAMRQVLDSALYYTVSEGIIIDIRDGFGGGPPVEYIQPFLGNGLESIIEESIWRNDRYKEAPVYRKPVVVLINSGSRSGKEVLAYYFKKTGRAVLVGGCTAGYVSGGRKKRISSDSILYYCVSMIFFNGKRLEGVGVEPDIEVPFDVRFAGGRDIQLERAKDEMVKLIEALD